MEIDDEFALSRSYGPPRKVRLERFTRTQAVFRCTESGEEFRADVSAPAEISGGVRLRGNKGYLYPWTEKHDAKVKLDNARSQLMDLGNAAARGKAGDLTPFVDEIAALHERIMAAASAER